MLIRGPGGAGGLGDGVLPGALARAAHHQQVAVTVSGAQRAPPPRGRSGKPRGPRRATIATMVSSVLLRPIVSPCQATLSRPSR